MKRSSIQTTLFQIIDMDALIPKQHIPRRLDETLDLSIVPEWTVPLYHGALGRPATNPELTIRLILLSYLFNHSERELYEILLMHADYLWFCELDFESVQKVDPSRPSLPDRSTPVKTRKL